MYLLRSYSELREEQEVFDILFLLPTPPQSIIGGYKVVYEYAGYMAEKGHKVCIAYNANKGINSKHIPKFAVYLIRKILGTFGPTWFRLNRSVKQKVMYDFARKIPASKITIATALETSFFLLSKINTKKYYFVQDFENWGISDEEVCRTYAFDMKKIAVAKWLKAEIEKYANESVCYVPNGVDPKVFNIRNKKRPEHSIAMLYHKDRRKGCDISLAVVHRLKQIYPDLVVNAFGSPRHPKDWPEWIRYNRNDPLKKSVR